MITSLFYVKLMEEADDQPLDYVEWLPLPITTGLPDRGRALYDNALRSST